MQGVDFNVEHFDSLIKQNGMRVLWEEASVCSCISKTGQPDYNCPYCNGSGFLYAEPKETVVASTRLVGKKVFDDIGMRETGTAFITSLSDILMGYQDRLTFVDYNSKYSQAIQVKYGKTLKLKRKIKSILSIYYKGILINTDNVTIINDGWGIEFPPDIINELEQGDKKFNSTNFNISILYITAPIYSIIDITHELRATSVGNSNSFRELPKQYLIKREDFIYGKKSAGED